MKAIFRRLMRPLLEYQVRRLVRVKKLKIVAVAGSVGKTSTRAAIAEVLAEKYRVQAYTGFYNDTVSVPLALFGLDAPSPITNPIAWVERLIAMGHIIRGRYPFDVAVIELGTDRRGEIPHFMKYLKPDIGVVTAVAPEHMENFDDIDAVAKEELALAKGSQYALVGMDQGWLVEHHDELEQRFVTYGSHGEVKWRGGHITLGEGRSIAVTPAVVGEHSKLALLAAAAVAARLELADDQIKTGLEKFTGVSGRMQPLAGVEGTKLIDDTYNSSPDAAIAALETLVSMPRRHIAIMGTMNELGDNSPEYHEEVGEASASVDVLVTVGQLANAHLGPAAVKSGLDRAKWYAAKSPYDAGRFVRQRLQPGDTVLAKGSQNGVFCEEAVKLLLADPADAAKLVRQSDDWQTIKHKQFPDYQV